MNNCRQLNAFQSPRTPYPQPNPNLFCVFCATANHNSNECSKYSSSKSFWQRVLADRRCKNCLRLYHRSDKCYSRSYCHFSACKRSDKHNSILCNLRYRTYQQPDFQQNHWFNGAQQPVNRSYRPRFKRQHLSKRKYFTPTPNRYDSLLQSSSVDHPPFSKPHDKSIEFKNVVAQTTDDYFVPSNFVHSSFVKPNENI